jgi:hypothetical protein
VSGPTVFGQDLGFVSDVATFCGQRSGVWCLVSSVSRPGPADAITALGECKEFMLSYLKCLKANASNNGQCRLESKRYLECRMDK